jgi:carboxymethylenebutenolidase
MSEMIKLSADGQDFSIYKAEPTAEIKGGVLVIHEVWGLNNHTKDIAGRFAAAGYVALAPDLIGEASPEPKLAKKLQEGLFNPDPKKRSEIQPKLRELMAPIKAPGFAEVTIKKLKSCVEYLSNQTGVGDNIASVGFCFGGTYSFSLAVYELRLKAAVPFYGHADFNTEELGQINCPILAFYGENDKALVDALPELKTKMQAAGVDFSSHVYPNCGHAFFNDTNPYAYNELAAHDAWDKTISFLADKLKKD